MTDPELPASTRAPGELQPLDPATRRERDAIIDEHRCAARGVLHLGAHTGQERDDYARSNLPVVWVEAHPILYRRLVANLAHSPDQQALHGLLADVDGRQVEFGRSANVNGESSSMYPFGPHAHALWPDQELYMIEHVTLPSITLDSLLAAEQIDPAHYDFWAMDVQGAELRALQGARQSLRACSALLLEVSTIEIYRGGALWPELRDHLADCGFAPAWMPIRPHDDVLFVPDRA